MIREKSQKISFKTEKQWKEFVCSGNKRRLSFNKPDRDGFTKTYLKFVNKKIRLFDTLTREEIETIPNNLFKFPSEWYEIFWRLK